MGDVVVSNLNVLENILTILKCQESKQHFILTIIFGPFYRQLFFTRIFKAKDVVIFDTNAIVIFTLIV